MARSIETIETEIFNSIAAKINLTGLTSTSKVAIWRLIVFVVAASIWTLEILFDTHKTEVDTAIANQKTGTLPWYRTKALAFQYGFDLIKDTDQFDNTNATDEQIEASKIIKYSAVDESEDESRIIIKIAGGTDGVLSNFKDAAQVEAIEAYFKEIKWPGKITIINYLADKLYLNIEIKRDPLILDDNGMSKFEANYPVEEALKEFMKELEFNGELRLSALTDKIQAVTGVKDATVLSASSSWIDPAQNGYAPPQPIHISKIAESGYFEIVNYDNVEYVV